MDKLRNTLGPDLLRSTTFYGRKLFGAIIVTILMICTVLTFPVQLIGSTSHTTWGSTLQLMTWFVLAMACIVSIFMLIPPTKGDIPMLKTHGPNILTVAAAITFVASIALFA